MSDKWQLINLKLEAPLAQALRNMKHGHDEPLSEVILRLLWKMVRQQNPLGGRGAPAGRSKAKGRGERGGSDGRRGNAAAPRGRAAGGKGRKPFVPREAPATGEWGAEGAQLEGGSARPRAPRKFGGKPGKLGKPFRPQRIEGGDEAPKRAFRPRNELAAGESRPRRPRKAKATRPRDD